MLSLLPTSSEFKKNMGWVALECPYCMNIVPFTYKTLVRRTIFLIFWSSRRLKDIIQCDFCDTRFEGPVDELPSPDKKWKRDDGIQSLVRLTNPQLGQVRYPDPWPEEAVRLSLNTLCNILHPKRAWLAWLLLPILIFCILATIETVRAIDRDPFESEIRWNSLLLLSALTAFPGSVIASRWRRAKANRALKKYTHHYGIDPANMEELCLSEPENFGIVYNALDFVRTDRNKTTGIPSSQD